MDIDVRPPEKPKRRRGPPSLPEPQAARVRTLLAELCQVAFNGNEAALGRAIGLTQSAVWQIRESRNRPSIQTVEKIAKVLGVSRRVLTEGKITPEALARQRAARVRAAAERGSTSRTGTEG